MATNSSSAFFSKIKPTEYVIEALTSSLDTSVSDLEVEDHELSNGQNIAPASDTSLQKRDGITLFGPLLGNLPVTGGFNFVTAGGTQRQLVCYNTGVNIHTSTASTPISGITLTQGLLCDGVYFPFTDKFYITNGTDTVAEVMNDGTGDQSTSVKKGKYITTFMNRLLTASTSANPDYVWYTDAQADTYTNSSTQFFQVSGAVIGLIAYYSKILIFTKRKIYRLENFTFDGTNSWANQLFELPVEFGSIAEGTIKIVNGNVYFVGQDMNNVAAIYACDGYTAQNISDKLIRNTAKGLASGQLTMAFAIADSMTYRVYLSESGQGTNNICLIYDTIRNYFYPPERRWIPGIADMSCLWSSENNGVWTVYGGTQINGQVYQFHSNSGLYDELPEEKDLTTGGSSYAVEEIGNLKVAESFIPTQYNTTNLTVPLTQVALNIKTNAGTPGTLVVRIETDTAGKPSGTLVASNATTTISSSLISSSFKYVMALFSTPVELTGNTSYWIVVQHAAGTQNSKYLVAGETGKKYASGNVATYNGTTWTKVTTANLNFAVYFQSPIDAYADTKAYLPVEGKEYKMIKFQSIFSQIGSYYVEVGFEVSGFTGTFKTFLVNLNPTGAGGKWDDNVSKWDDGITVWDGTPSRSLAWTDIGGPVNRTLKLRVRNRNANQQFEFNKIIFELLPRLRNV